MSQIGNALIINVAVLAVVLEADIGPHRKVGWFRVVRPVIESAIIVPFFIKGFSFGGDGLLLELAGIALGIVLGLVALRFMRVFRRLDTGHVVTRAGWSYAIFWLLVIGARVLFTVGTQYWFPDALGRWLERNSIGANALTDGLILMAILLLITRSLGLGVKAARLRRSASGVVVPV